jgi:hypothetical protein
MNHFNVRNITIEEWLHGANGQIDRVNNADSLGLLFHLLVSFFRAAF